MSSQGPNEIISKLAARRGIDADEMLKDFERLDKIKQSSEVPSRMNLSSDERSMGFGALMQAKVSESKGCSTGELDAEMEKIRVKYNLNSTQSKLLTDEMSAKSKGRGSSIIRVIILLLSMGAIDMG